MCRVCGVFISIVCALHILVTIVSRKRFVVAMDELEVVSHQMFVAHIEDFTNYYFV